MFLSLYSIFRYDRYKQYQPMKAVFERKQFNLKALDIDTTSKSVKVAIAQLGSVDSDRDIFSQNAFDKTLAERGPQGANTVWFMIDHSSSIKSALGKFSELYKDGNYIVGVGRYKEDHALWRDTVWPLYRDGDINQHSVGFTTVKSGQYSETVREITEVALWEGSAVLFGANPNTPTLGVTKSMLTASELETEIKRYDILIKSIRAGRFDEDNSLLLLELKRLQQLTIDLTKTSTQPEEKSTEPDSVKELIDLQTQIKHTITGLFN